MTEQNVEDMETEGGQNAEVPVDSQPHEAVKDPEAQLEDSKEEIAKVSSDDHPDASVPEKGKCPDPPPSSFIFPGLISDNHQNSPSLHSSPNNGLNQITDHIAGSRDIDTLSAAMPSLDLNSDDKWPPLGHPVPQTPCPYNLRSMVGKSGPSVSVGGLGVMASQSLPKNKRGIISDLSKAKLKAKLDVADGKQYSIPGVLRVVQNPGSVIK